MVKESSNEKTIRIIIALHCKNKILVISENEDEQSFIELKVTGMMKNILENIPKEIDEKVYELTGIVINGMKQEGHIFCPAFEEESGVLPIVIEIGNNLPTKGNYQFIPLEHISTMNGSISLKCQICYDIIETLIKNANELAYA